MDHNFLCKMADNTVKKVENTSKDSYKNEDKPHKGVSGEESKDDQDEGPRMTTKPKSFTWTGKRKSDPLNTIKPFGMSGSKGGAAITIKLNAPDAKKKKAEPVVQKKAASVAAAFGDDESDEEEEIPPEARMRMRNIGRDTPTSAGPNSFNKGKRGFTHQRKVFEKQLNESKPP